MEEAKQIADQIEAVVTPSDGKVRISDEARGRTSGRA
jgi:hypothetical protein